MGQGGKITFVNGTRCDWESLGQRSYQMNSWDFPAVIAAGTTATVYVEWGQSIFKTQSDDSGVVTYTLSGTDLSFQLVASAGNGFDLSVVLTSLSTPGNPQGSTINLEWNHDGFVNFILAGGPGSLTSSNPPSGWMQENLGLLGSQSLRHLCIPGSHDSGMSTFTSGTAFGTANNTQAQTLDVSGQLQLGVRYFDIRPVVSGGQYYTGHYSGPIDLPVIGPSMQGANGQSIASIISDVNTYTANNQELVVLYLSHDMETDLGSANYPPFTQDNWNGLLAQLKGLNHLFVAPNPTTVDLTLLKLSDFIGSQAAVVVVVDPAGSGITLGDFAAQGFYTPINFSVYNQYADTNDLSTMQTNQLGKLAAQRPNPDAGYFLLSWTLTQSNAQAAVPGSESILELAATANPALYSALLPVCSTQTYPNILYIDGVNSSDIAALAMAVNSKAMNG